MEKTNQPVIYNNEQDRIHRLREFSRKFCETSERLDAFLRGKTTLSDEDRAEMAELDGAMTGIALEWVEFTARTRR